LNTRHTSFNSFFPFLSQRRCLWVFLVVAVLGGAPGGSAAFAADVVESLEPNVQAVLRNGRQLFLECSVPSGRSAESFLKRFLKDGRLWRNYVGSNRVAIPFAQLNPTTQRAVLLAVFRKDYVEEEGWVHVVTYAGGPQGQETLWALCEWLTGNGFNQSRIKEHNQLQDVSLKPGQIIRFPKELLAEAFRNPTPERQPEPVESSPAPVPSTSATQDDSGEIIDFEGLKLEYGKDEEGPFALYRLRPGEASLYTPVVVRFTDYRENSDILAACEVIARRSGITDVTKMETGQPIKIPLDMLSARFRPEGSPERREYEETIKEAQRLRTQNIRAAGLEGVVVILDPGHGGEDPGADALKLGYHLYEDELNYDIACRIKDLLERTTRAKVYMTVRDRSQGYAPVQSRNFVHDKDEELLTNPPYPNTNPKYSANLRWYLTNYWYRKEIASGVDPRKVVFASIHCDALFNGQLRGAMIYVPGASYRRTTETPEPRSFFKQFQEAQDKQTTRFTLDDLRRDEALSRNFAEVLLNEMGKKRVKRHDAGPPIRDVIRQSGGKFYLPAVLRNTEVPTKILVETANMTNPTDCMRLSDPEWRQLFAEAFVNALKTYYGS